MEEIKMPFCEMPQIDRSEGFDKVYAMDIEDFPNLFSSEALNELQKAGLNKIGSVISVVDRGTISKYTNILNIVEEVEAAVKLIRCEYFDKNPLISENDTFPLSVLASQLGLTYHAVYLLEKCNEVVNIRSFFSLLREPNAIDILSHKPFFAGEEIVLKEILEKASIVMRYYDRMKVQKTDKGALHTSTSVIGDHQPENEQKSSSDIDELVDLRKVLADLEDLYQKLSKAIADTRAYIDQNKEKRTKGTL